MRGGKLVFRTAVRFRPRSPHMRGVRPAPALTNSAPLGGGNGNGGQTVYFSVLMYPLENHVVAPCHIFGLQLIIVSDGIVETLHEHPQLLFCERAGETGTQI